MIDKPYSIKLHPSPYVTVRLQKLLLCKSALETRSAAVCI